MGNVLIVGNGFDLALHLPTRYADFVNNKKYWPLNEIDSAHYGEDNLYNFIYDFTEKHRNSLGEVRWIDLEDLLLSYVKTKIGKSVTFESDKAIVEYDKEVFELIKRKFVQYIVDVVNPSITGRSKLGGCVSDVIEPIVENGTFDTVYTFNYTDTGKIIEFLYKWSPRVVHLHGKVMTYSGEIVLGIGACESIPKEYRFMLKSYSEAYFDHNLSADLYAANEIVFYGLSLGEADFVYFKQFFHDCIANYKSGQKKKVIHIVTNDENSRLSIMDSIEDSGLEMRKMYDCITLKFYKSKDFGLGINGVNPFDWFRKHMKETTKKGNALLNAEVDAFMANRIQNK